MRRTDDRSNNAARSSWPPWRPRCGRGGLGNSRRWATTSPAFHGRRDGCRTSPTRQSPTPDEHVTGSSPAGAAVDVTAGEVATQVDHRLIGSALSRVTWELDVLQSWRRDPVFHVHQALGPYFDLLLPLPPFDDEAGRIDRRRPRSRATGDRDRRRCARTARRTADDSGRSSCSRVSEGGSRPPPRPSPSTSRRLIGMPSASPIAPAVAVPRSVPVHLSDLDG